MKVYLVEDCGNSPGKIYAIFASEAAVSYTHLTLPTNREV